MVSILANYAKKYNRVVLLSMEKPRSDIFPFLDRVTYLCLGDVVYTGATRMMLDYFRSIGFPCPELENPLMYYCKYTYLNSEFISNLKSQYKYLKKVLRGQQITLFMIHIFGLVINERTLFTHNHSSDYCQNNKVSASFRLIKFVFFSKMVPVNNRSCFPI